jgi:hypothetical protein
MAMGKLEQYTDIVGKGIFANALPSIFRDMVLNLLKDAKVKDAIIWATTNHDLWAEISPKQRSLYISLGPKLGKMNWLTADWLIEAIGPERPDLSSLFASWPAGKVWLTGQITQIKQQLHHGAAPPVAPAVAQDTLVCRECGETILIPPETGATVVCKCGLEYQRKKKVTETVKVPDVPGPSPEGV